VNDDRLLTFKEACAVLRIGRGKMFELLKARAFPHVRVGRKILIKKADLDRFIEKQTVK
jgi:excisionase family DNA binding protein